MANVLAVAETRDGDLKPVSREVVTAARKVADGIGGNVEVLVVGGSGTAEAARSLSRYGADRILTVEHDDLATYQPEGYTTVIAEQAKAGDYYAVLFPATAAGRDVAPRVAARLDVPLATEITGLEMDGDEMVVTRPLYGGKVFAELTLDATPRIASLRGNVFRPEENPREATVESVDASVDAGAWKVKVRELKESAGDRPDVAEASTVVSGGRGLKEAENWTLIEELADALGDGVGLGASRAVVDAGWRPHSEQVGQTGKIVAPQLYFAIGISGAIQHLAGMRTAGTIVAINKDPDAPIFKVADYGIVGDAFEVVPKLTEEIRSRRQE